MADDPPYEKYDPPRPRGGQAGPRARCARSHFRRDGDAVFVWTALDLARVYEMPLPTWVVNYLFDGAHRMMDMLDEAMAGEPITDVAARVGHVLGFGNHRGQGGGFQRAALIERDKDMFFDVIDAVRPTKVSEKIDGQRHLVAWGKLDFAYDVVANDWEVSRSVVVKACSSVLERWRATVPEDEMQLREVLSSMQNYIRFEFRCMQEAFNAMNERDEGALDDEVS